MLRPMFVPITKVDEEKRMVYGYASTPELDTQGDIVTLDAMRDALPEYMKFPAIREMHQPLAAGRTVVADVDEGGLYIGAHIVDDAAWRKVKSRVYGGFSIGGNVTGRDDERITALELIEISLVDSPANRGAVISLWKLGKGGEGNMFKLSKYGGVEVQSEDDVEKVIDKAVTAATEKLSSDKKTLIDERDALKKRLAELSSLSAEAIALQAKVESLEKAAAERDEKETAARMKKLLDGAIAAGKFEAADRKDWEATFLKSGEAVTERILKKMPAIVPIGKRQGVGGEGEESTQERCEKIVRTIMSEEKVTYDKAYAIAYRKHSKLFQLRDDEQLAAARGGTHIPVGEE